MLPNKIQYNQKHLIGYATFSNTKGLSKNDFSNFYKNTFNVSLQKQISDTGELPTITEATQVGSLITSPLSLTFSDSRFRRNVPLYGWTSAGLSAYGVAGSTSGSNLGKNVSVIFYTDALSIEFSLLHFNTSCVVKVNDAIVIRKSLTSSGQPFKLKLDYTTRIVRKVEIYGINMPFEGVRFEATASVYWPSEIDAKDGIFWFGDSYTQSTGAASIIETYAGHASRLLNIEYVADGVGGTGWNSTSANAVATRVTNYFNTIIKKPTTVVTCFGYNDAGGNMITLQTNYAAFVTAVRAINPTVRIITFGAWTPLGNTTNLDLVDAALTTACTANSTTFISLRNVVNSVNKTVYTAGDNVHPTVTGHEFLGFYIAKQIRNLSIF